MTPPRTLVDSLARVKILRSPWKRRVIIAVLLLLCVMLALFPERYRAAVTFAPADPASLGLSGAVGQLGAINSVFGNQAAIEVAVKVARSTYVRQEVIRQLDLVRKMNFANDVEASRWLDKKVVTRTMRGGIVQTEYLGRDPEFGRTLVAAYASATQVKLADIAKRQTAYKREILMQLVEEAEQRLDIAQDNYNKFRLRTRYSDPTFAIGAIGERIPVLEAAIKAKEVELNAARQFATDSNMSVNQIIAQIDALKRQLAQFRALNPQQDSSIGRVVKQSTEADKLERKLLLAQMLFDSYTRFLQGVSVENLVSTANVRVLEAPFVDTARQLNYAPLAMGILLLMFALAVEFYEWRPPVGDRKARLA